MVMISAIAALSENNVIGRGNALPWHIPEDLKFFKSTTSGKPVIMGRKTFDSIGRALPNRLNIVITRSDVVIPGVRVCQTVARAIDIAQKSGAEEIMVIGGAQIYEQALPLCNRLYLTRVHAQVDGDTFFPTINLKQWREISCDRREGNPAFSFVVLERI